MRLKKLWPTLSGLLLVPVILIALLLIYLQSSSFSNKLSSMASEAMGSTVQLGQDINVVGLFPDIVLQAPNVLIKSHENDSEMWRARLQNLQVTLSPSLLLSEATKGEIGLDIGRASIIAELAGDNSDAELQASRDIDIGALRAGMQSLMASVRDYSNVSATLAINQINIITRDSKKRSTKYFAKDTLVNFLDTQLNVTTRIVWNDLVEQQMNMRLTELTTDSTDGPAVLSGKLDLEISPSAGVHSAAKLTAGINLQNDSLAISQLEARTDWLWLRADASASWHTSDVQFKADIETRLLELSALLVEDGERQSDSTDERLFTYDIFKNSLPMNVSGHIDLHLGAVRLDTMPFINGPLDIALTDGVLQIAGNDLMILGGSSTLSVEVDNTLAQFVAFKSKLEVDELQLSRIRMGENTDAVVSQGNADLIISLKGEGPSPGHIAASLDGYVLAGMSDAKVNQKYSTLIDRGIVSWALQKANLWPGGKTDDSVVTSRLSDPLYMECISLRVYINDGRAEVSNGAIIDFPDNTLFSSGYIDLASEQLGFAFRTRSRSLFDWSAISIIKYAEISGTLVQPNVALNTKELAKQGIKSASSVAWGPLPGFVYSLAEAGIKNASSGSCKSSIW